MEEYKDNFFELLRLTKIPESQHNFMWMKLIHECYERNAENGEYLRNMVDYIVPRMRLMDREDIEKVLTKNNVQK